METNPGTALDKALTALRSNPSDPEAVIADFEARADSLDAEAKALRQIASGMRTLAGKPPKADAQPTQYTPLVAGPPQAPMRPEGMEAVRRIMKDGGVWSARSVLVELKKHGWESKSSSDPIRPTEAAMNRMWKVKKEIERVGRGEYRYIGSPASPTPSGNELGLLNGAGGP
jgi:hypothetical protein